MIDREYARNELDQRETDELVEILVARDEDAWRPEIFPLVEELLRERDVDVTEAVDARKRLLEERAAAASAAAAAADAEPVAIAEFDDEVEAEMCQVALTRAGIEARVMQPPGGGGSPLRLLVAAADADAARDALAATEAPEEADSEGFRCPSCGFIAEPLREAGSLVCQVCGASA